MIIVYTTFPNKKSAEKLADKILKARLAACINFWPINSQYWWSSSAKASKDKSSKIEKTKEWTMIIKTERKNYQKIEKLIKKNHPYQIPAIFSWSIEKVEKDYLKWFKKEVK